MRSGQFYNNTKAIAWVTAGLRFFFTLRIRKVRDGRATLSAFPCPETKATRPIGLYAQSRNGLSHERE
jgi:hypothetical protein